MFLHGMGLEKEGNQLCLNITKLHEELPKKKKRSKTKKVYFRTKALSERESKTYSLKYKDK